MTKKDACKVLSENGISHGVNRFGSLVVCFGNDLYTLSTDDTDEFHRNVATLKAERDQSIRKRLDHHGRIEIA